MSIVQQGRGGRGRRRAPTSTTVVRKNFVTPIQNRRELSGYSPQGPFDPPRVIATPWNTIVLAGLSAAIEPGITSTTVAQLAVLLKSQIGIPTAAEVPFLFRFMRIGIWSTITDTVNGVQSLALLPADLNRGGSVRAWIEDRGTIARPSHCHWVWSRPESLVTFHSVDNASVVIYEVDHGNNYTWNSHVHVLWRPAGGDPIPTSTATTTVALPHAKA